jgi:hypothetical protein
LRVDDDDDVDASLALGSELDEAGVAVPVVVEDIADDVV